MTNSWTRLGLILSVGAATWIVCGHARAERDGSRTELLDMDESSSPPQVGELALDFHLPSSDGSSMSLSNLLDSHEVVVIEWFNPTCVYCVKYHETLSTMSDLYQHFGDQNVAWVAINSGHPESGTADPELNESTRLRWNMHLPVLLDPSGAVGKAYGARVTPEYLVISKDGHIVYRGALDNGSGDTGGDIQYLSTALDEFLAGESINWPNTRVDGCAVKYRED